VSRRHPAFSSTYENTKQKTVAHLSPCFVLIHQEALQDVINVLVALLKDTGLLDAEPAAPASAPTATRASNTATRKSQAKSALIVRPHRMHGVRRCGLLALLKM